MRAKASRSPGENDATHCSGIPLSIHPSTYANANANANANASDHPGLADSLHTFEFEKCITLSLPPSLPHLPPFSSSPSPLLSPPCVRVLLVVDTRTTLLLPARSSQVRSGHAPTRRHPGRFVSSFPAPTTRSIHLPPTTIPPPLHVSPRGSGATDRTRTPLPQRGTDRPTDASQARVRASRSCGSLLSFSPRSPSLPFSSLLLCHLLFPHLLSSASSPSAAAAATAAA